MSIHRVSLILLYLLTCLLTVYLVIAGDPYYSLSIADRPNHVQHELWKPSGAIGHGIGILGSLLMLILLLYSARKRYAFMQKWGNIRYWLNYHIWMGITGPILVLFHTAFKFGGIVSVSFWSMMAVALSGVLGRYIYIQIPRTLSGKELSGVELEDMDRQLVQTMREIQGVDETTIRLVGQISETEARSKRGGYANVLVWLLQDLALPFRLRRIKASLRQHKGLSVHEIHAIIQITKRRARLRRRIAFLSTAHDLLHHWHIIHKPFAAVMLVIMIVHVAVTLLFGYHWIF
jgi:hypothetical protein